MIESHLNYFLQAGGEKLRRYQWNQFHKSRVDPRDTRDRVDTRDTRDRVDTREKPRIYQYILVAMHQKKQKLNMKLTYNYLK